MLKILTSADFDAVYDIMKISFPVDEMRPYEAQKALFSKKYFKLLALTDAGNANNSDDRKETVMAFITVYELEKILFVEHFAVDPRYRNHGLGGQILEEIKNIYDKPLCLEVELPENETARRRIGFYQRNGFYLNPQHYLQPPLAAGQNPVELKLMTTRSPLSDAEFESVRNVIYKEVYEI